MSGMTNTANWGVKETYKLLELWSRESVQANLLTMKRNIDVFNQIASEMMAAGFLRTGIQCQSKIKKMKVVYRKIKSKMEANEEVEKEWQYFEIFDKVLNSSTEELPQVASILAEIMGRSDSATLDGRDDSHEEDGIENNDSNEGQLQAAGNSLIMERLRQTSDSSPSPTPDRTLTEPSLRGTDLVRNSCVAGSRKRKRKEKKVVAILSELVQKVIDAKMKSDLKMVELEEKRLKLEERRMEREAEVRREEREFQLRMLQCMMESQLGRAEPVVAGGGTSSQQSLPTVNCPTDSTTELSTQEEDTVYDSVLDDTITSKDSKSIKSVCSFSDGSQDQTVDNSMRSVDSIAELDRSKPYVPVLERSSQLVEDSEVDTSRVVIDANPAPLRKKAAKRKRKQEKIATNEGCKRGKYQLRNRNKTSSSVTPPPEPTETDHQSATPIHQPAISTMATITLPEASADDSTPKTLARLKKGLTSGKKALASVTKSKRKLRKQNVAAPMMAEESPVKPETRRADIRLGGKVRRVQQT